MTEFDENYDEEWDPDYKSRTQIKKELNELKELGRSLVGLPKRDLDKLNLDEDLYDAILKAQGMSKGALKRQIGFIGGLISKLDYEQIQQDYEKSLLPHQGEVRRFHELESWRDQLVAGDSHIYGDLMAEFADFDMQHVRQLVRNAQKEVQQNKPPKSARALFQYIQQLDSDN